MRKLLVLLAVVFTFTGCCTMKKMCPVGCDKPCCAKTMDAAKTK
ncbi:MAG: hypothetical protein AB7S78_09045 [Candidatus Omnitrophota bacterium]